MSILLCQNMVIQNIDKLPKRYKKFYIKTTANKFRTNYLEKIGIKSDAKKMKIMKYQKLLLLYIIVILILTLPTWHATS